MRADQQWCTLCMHVLHKPAPPPNVLAAVMAPPPAVGRHAAPATAATDVTTTPAAGDKPFAPLSNPEAEAAAEALLAQLAVEARRDRLNVPSYLDSKAKVAVACAVGMAGLTAVGLLLLTVFGAIVG